MIGKIWAMVISLFFLHHGHAEDIYAFQDYAYKVFERKNISLKWNKEREAHHIQKKRIWQERLPQISLEQQWSESRTEILSRQVKQHQAATSLKNQWTLFEGGQEWVEYSLLKLKEKQTVLIEQEEHRTLLKKMMDDFFQYWLVEKEWEIMAEFLKMSEERLSWLQERIRLGRLRKSEYPAAMAQRQLWQSQYQALTLQKTGLKQQMSLEMGLDLHYAWSIQPFVPDDWQAWEKSLSVQDVPDLSFSQSLDLLSQRSDHLLWNLEKEILQKEKQKLWQAHYPKGTLTSRYYLDKSRMHDHHDWDVAFTLTWPLFAGGTTQSYVKEKKNEMVISSLEHEEKRKEQKILLQQLDVKFQSMKEQQPLLQKALDSAKENYHLQKQDALQGLVQQNEVLNALNTYLDVKRQREKSRLMYYQSLLERQLFLGTFQLNVWPKHIPKP